VVARRGEWTERGEVMDMNKLKIWEPLAVKLQTYKTAIETAILLLRIDDIVSGSKKASEPDQLSAEHPDNQAAMAMEG